MNLEWNCWVIGKDEFAMKLTKLILKIILYFLKENASPALQKLPIPKYLDLLLVTGQINANTEKSNREEFNAAN